MQSTAPNHASSDWCSCSLCCSSDSARDSIRCSECVCTADVDGDCDCKDCHDEAPWLANAEIVETPFQELEAFQGAATPAEKKQLDKLEHCRQLCVLGPLGKKRKLDDADAKRMHDRAALVNVFEHKIRPHKHRVLPWMRCTLLQFQATAEETTYVLLQTLHRGLQQMPPLEAREDGSGGTTGSAMAATHDHFFRRHAIHADVFHPDAAPCACCLMLQTSAKVAAAVAAHGPPEWGGSATCVLAADAEDAAGRVRREFAAGRAAVFNTPPALRDAAWRNRECRALVEMVADAAKLDAFCAAVLGVCAGLV